MIDWRPLIVERTEEIAAGIRALVLRTEDGSMLPRPAPGAHLDVELQPGLIRQYSLCGDPEAERGKWVIAVKREPSSRGGSLAIHTSVNAGCRLRVGPVQDRFAPDPAARRHCLVAGGIGITPMLSMARYLHEAGAEWSLHYFGRSLGEMAFVAALQCPPFTDKVRLHVGTPLGDVATRLAAALGFFADGTTAYLCGPPAMMQAARQVASALGWPDTRLRSESFAPVPSDGPVSGTGDRAFTLVLVSNGTEIRVEANETTLEALRRAGLPADSSCEAGVCGTCLTRVVDGSIDHRDSYLTDDERAAGKSFLPCVSRAASERLVVDL